jgi:hypothetical protein
VRNFSLVSMTLAMHAFTGLESLECFTIVNHIHGIPHRCQQHL